MDQNSLYLIFYQYYYLLFEIILIHEDLFYI